MYVHELQNPTPLAARWFETVVDYSNGVNMYWTESGSEQCFPDYFSKKLWTNKTNLSLSLGPLICLFSFLPPVPNPYSRARGVLNNKVARDVDDM